MPIVRPELRRRLSAGEAIIPAVSRDMANPPWEEARLRLLILRLSPFADVEGSSSHLVLFAECRAAMSGAYIDFGFFPDARDRAALAAEGQPFLFGLESGRHPGDFELVLVSNSFALELVNLPYLFSASGLACRASERAARGGAPIVLLGGSNAASAGALLYAGGATEAASDAMVEGIFFGEGEDALGEIVLAAARGGPSRRGRLEALASVPGLWLAGSGVPASRRVHAAVPRARPRYPVLNGSLSATARLQISSGCPGYCSFCLEGWESRPYRELPAAEAAAAARELKAATGASSLEVYSFNFNAHSGIFELFLELNKTFRRVSFMSQRLDLLADSPALLGFELAADKRSFTLGIEGISERMRAFYRKGVAEAQIDAALAKLAIPAARELKLFYIIAGIEDDSDFAEFAAFAARAAARRGRDAPGQRILVSVGYLARLPFTPLQYSAPCLDRERLEGLARRLEGHCARAGLEFRLAADFEEYYVDQLLALGGRALAPWIEACPAAGIAYDGGLARGTGASLEAFARKAGLVGGGRGSLEGEKAEGWEPPLAFIDEGSGALRAAYRLASSFAPRPGLAAQPEPPAPAALRGLERLMAAKRSFASILVRLTLPESLARATGEYRSAYLLRELGAAAFDAEDALFSKGSALDGMAERYWGLALYRILGPDAGRLAAGARAAGFELLPGMPAIARVEASIRLPGSFGPEAEAAFRDYLSFLRIGATERHFRGEGGAPIKAMEIAPRDLRKKSVLEARLIAPEAAGSDFEIRLALGQKAELEPFMSRLGIEARRASSLRIEGLVSSSPA